MDGNTWALLTAATMAVAIISAVTWLRRPHLRRNRVLAVALGVSAVALTLEVIFLVLVLVALASLPDMSES